MNGEGELTWPDGRKYIGKFTDDKKDGYGEYYWQNGAYYKGNWKDGK